MKQRRLRELIETHQRIASERNSARIGEKHVVLVEKVFVCVCVCVCACVRVCVCARTHVQVSVWIHLYAYASYTYALFVCTLNCVMY